MKKMKIFKSVLLLALAALLLATTLVSCGNKQTTAIDTSVKFEDANAEQYFARVLQLDATAKQNFIAAFRGYDVQRSSFNDAEVDPTKAVAVDMYAARAAMLAAATVGKDMVAGLTPEQLNEIKTLVALDVTAWGTQRAAKENWYADSVYFLACLMRGHSLKDSFLAEGADTKAILEQIVGGAYDYVGSLTAGQMMDIHYWTNTALLNETQWQEKLVAETTWAQNGILYYADMIRRAGKTEDFAKVKLFVDANALADINVENAFDPANVPTFSYTDAEGTVHAVAFSGDAQYVLAINDGAMRWAVSGLRPTDAMHAERFDAWLNELAADPARIAAVAGAIRVNQDLSADKFPQILLVGIGRALGWMTKYLSFNNYVIGLLWFAILIEAALIYFSIRQQKNSIKQAKLSPKERAIRKKYEGRKDQPSMQKMNEEIQKLYQEEGFNPMGGCLPLLIQMPIVIFLYQIVIDPLRYMLGMGPNYSAALSTFAQASRAAGGLGLGADAAKRGTISLISRIQATGDWDAMKSFGFFGNSSAIHGNLNFENLPNFRFLGMDTGFMPSEPGKIWPLILVPILTFVAYFISMKFSRKLSYQPAAQDPQMGCSNNMMDITMPLMSVYIAFITPAAIGIYWIFKCLTGMLKQFIMSKVMPLPTFTEEEYKKAEKEMKGKNKNKQDDKLVATDDGRVYRSLHHIDDDE